MSQPRRIDSTLPRPTLSQRVRSMSDSELIMAAGGLSQRTDAASAEALRAVTAETQRRGFRL